MTQTVNEADDDRQPLRRPSPPTARVVAIVELLTRTAAGDPQGRTTLSLAEIVRLTGLSRATAHAIVIELAAHQWLHRDDASGEFGIGRAFVNVARLAVDADHLSSWAGDAMRHLADTTLLPCFLAQRTPTDDAITVMDHIWPDGAPPGAAPWFESGREIPLRPPAAREFLAWADDATKDAWIGRGPSSSRTRLRMALDAVRERGYSIERMTDAHTAVLDALASLEAVPTHLRGKVDDLLAELTTVDYLPGELVGEVSAVTIGAPIFDAAGVVVASLVACPNTTMSADDLRILGRQTRAAADEVTARIA